MSDDAAPVAHGTLTGDPLTRPRPSLPDRLLLWLADRRLRRGGIGQLRVTLPSGVTADIGCGKTTDAKLLVRSYRALLSIARRGALGFAESYMDGDLDTDDLKAFFEFYFANERSIMAAFPRFNDTRPLDRSYHEGRPNTRDGSRRNIADHYDLGNEFYRLWLDAEMVYSSGIYPDGVSNLELAQRTKLERVVAALELQPGHRVLEIGCGWGAMALAMARRGAHVRAITISAEQQRAALQRVAEAELAGRAEVVFEDYRDTTGSFDRLVSIEMIEAVGEDHWPLFFGTIAERLCPGGVAVIQAISIREDAFAQYRRNPDFIQRYIFPGGMLPTVTLMRERAELVGLTFEPVERFATSYAMTLAEWRRRFELAWPRIAAMGFDERFRRMWLYYLTYCEVGFEAGLIDVGLYRMRKSSGA